MKSGSSAVSLRSAWQNNKPFIWFTICLLLIYSVLKILFYNYNHAVLFSSTGPVIHKSSLVKWSLFYDGLTILLINTAFLLLLQAGRIMHPKISARVTVPLFVLINSLAVLLNIADIFYFRFPLQRANAGLLYVLDHPFRQLFHQNIFIIASFWGGIIVTVILMWWLHKKLYTAFVNGHRQGLVTIILVLGLVPAVIFKDRFSRILLPAYPLVEIKSNQLPIVQNSFHTFLYSVFRGQGNIGSKAYLSPDECDSLFPVKKLLHPVSAGPQKRNIVLFIMESVPYDFFDAQSPYKVKMPFFDSLLQRSTFYTNAFAYSHESNKGISAILGGVPTITDVPLYHSPYINMPVTRIGSSLKKQGYRSFFCIGDDYDNFGFAKCMNWLDIEKYYSREDIPGHQRMESHSMGLQDEYVLNFMHQKINTTRAPFFAINYNISTHYPYDLPSSFKTVFPENYTSPMKSMCYYDHCLQQFFNAAGNEPWFRQTVFIFCSDHWLAPDDEHIKFNAISGYRIPLIIFDPMAQEKKADNRLRSQLDVMSTILSFAGYRDTVISYGANLADSSSKDDFVVARANAHLYHVTDSAYILGFNSSNDTAEFLYHYTTDTALRYNLVNEKTAGSKLAELTLKAKAFLQKAYTQYNNQPFR